MSEIINLLRNSSKTECLVRLLGADTEDFQELLDSLGLCGPELRLRLGPSSSLIFSTSGRDIALSSEFTSRLRGELVR